MARISSPVPGPALAELSAQIERKLTVPEQVAQALRDLILRGDLGAGAPVVESQLARQLRVGQPTVREALKTLESEGLIERHPNRGCAVMTLTRDDLEQIYVLRRQWEPLAVELALKSWNADKASTLRAAMTELSAAAAGGDARRYYDADLAFHETLWALSGNRYLKKALRQVVLPMFAFYVTHLHRLKILELTQACAEHVAIGDAMLAGDLPGALAALHHSLATFDRSVDLVLN